jgi:hypothetical protein
MHLVGFIIKQFVTMQHGYMNVKFLKLQLFISITFAVPNDLQFVERRKSLCSFKIFILVPILPIFPRINWQLLVILPLTVRARQQQQGILTVSKQCDILGTHSVFMRIPVVSAVTSFSMVHTYRRF